MVRMSRSQAPPSWNTAAREAMRTRITDAALALFVAHGYEATTYDQIAERAGVARRTVFNHFPRKADILAVWSDHRRTALATANREDRARHLTAQQTLRDLMRRLALINESDAALARVLVSGWLTEYGRVAEPFPVFDAFKAALEAGRADGELKAELSTDAAAEILTSSYTDTLQRWLGSPTGHTETGDLERRLLEKLDIVLLGIARPE